MKKRNSDIKFDWNNNTITFNLKFAKAATNPTSDEFGIVRELKEQYPNFRFVTKSARTKKKARPDKGLTFKKMESYIKTYKNSEELLLIFDIVKIRGKNTPSSKKFVTDWFLAQFPNYKDATTVAPNTIALPIPVPKETDYKLKENA